MRRQGEPASAQYAALAEDSYGRVDRGYNYVQLGQYERAIQDYDKAIQLDPNEASAYYLRGVAYGQLGEHVEASADKAKACSLDSQYC